MLEGSRVNWGCIARSTDDVAPLYKALAMKGYMLAIVVAFR